MSRTPCVTDTEMPPRHAPVNHPEAEIKRSPLAPRSAPPAKAVPYSRKELFKKMQHGSMVKDALPESATAGLKPNGGSLSDPPLQERVIASEICDKDFFVQTPGFLL